MVRKYIVGFLVGLLVASALPAYAAVDSFVGRKVQTEYPVSVDGKQLDDKAIVIDGKGFVPVREYSEALGYTAKFKDGEIISKEKFRKTGEPPLKEAQQ